MYLFGVLEHGEQVVDLRHIILCHLQLLLHQLLIITQGIYYFLEKQYYVLLNEIAIQ